MTQDVRRQALDERRLELEHERWIQETRLREQELEIRRSEQRSRETEVELKRREHSRAEWRSPLVVAILAAAIAAAGSAVVSVINGVQERQVEAQRAEQARILEMIKTGNTETAAENLQFLLDSGLIDDPQRAEKIRLFLANRPPGTGPALPGTSAFGGIVGSDDARDLSSLPGSSGVGAAGRAVGRLHITLDQDEKSACTGFLVGPDLLLTAGHCSEGAKAIMLHLSDSATSDQYSVHLPPLEEVTGPDANYSLLRVSGNPGLRYGAIALAPSSAGAGDELAAVYFRADATRKLVVIADECRVLASEGTVLHHGCDTGAGSAGAPILTLDGQAVALHFSRSQIGGKAVHASVIAEVLEDYLPQ